MREGYIDFVKRTGNQDCKTTWKWWRMEAYGMTEVEAMRDADVNYKPIKEQVAAAW